MIDDVMPLVADDCENCPLAYRCCTMTADNKGDARCDEAQRLSDARGMYRWGEGDCTKHYLYLPSRPKRRHCRYCWEELGQLIEEELKRGAHRR